MEVSSATASRLGEKLAGLDRTDEEGALLVTLLSPDADDEVEGFRKGGLENTSKGYTEVEWT